MEHRIVYTENNLKCRVRAIDSTHVEIKKINLNDPDEAFDEAYPNVWHIGQIYQGSELYTNARAVIKSLKEEYRRQRYGLVGEI